MTLDPRDSAAEGPRASSDVAEIADGDPRAELARLSRALRHQLARQAGRGRTRVPALPGVARAAEGSPAAAAPRTGAPKPSTPMASAPGPRAPEFTGAATPPARSLPSSESQPVPVERPSSPAPTAALAGSGDAAVAPRPGLRVARAALEAAEVQAKEIRARAQACPDLESLRAEVAKCTACSLCRTRTQTVFMDGKGRVPVMFVGEAPGANEDQQGIPFVGRAGALLTDIITKGMGLAREDVVIANVLKCRPPENRDPSDVEKTLCTPFLDRQIELVAPKVLIPLGGHAAKHVLRSESSLGALRGRVHERGGRKVVPTFHPAYLLRSPGEKAECWKDIQLAMAELGIARPPSRPGS